MFPENKLLVEEILKPLPGVCVTDLYREKGMNLHPASSRTERYGDIAYTLFTGPTPYIYPHEVIAGSLRSVYAEHDAEDVRRATDAVKAFGIRRFWSNADHFAPDYRRVLRLGLPGLFREIDDSIAVHAGEEDRVTYLRAMRHALSGLCEMILSYAARADELIGTDGYDDTVLSGIADVCRKIADRAPEHFREALQLVWFCHIGFSYERRNAQAIGRIDQYLFPFYRKDIESGYATDDDILFLLENFCAMVKEARETTNICIGGQNKAGECEVNALSYLVLKAVGNVQLPGPNLSARVTADMPDDFFDECLRTIGTGLGYPALMNDDVNIAALKSYGYDEDDVYDYCFVGCIENFLPGLQPPWSDGRFDAPRFLEYLLNNGESYFRPLKGLDTGSIDTIHDMDELMRRFELQLRAGIDGYMEWFYRVNHEAMPEELVYTSLFLPTCVTRGLDVNAGGAKYPAAHGAGCMGIGTIADSLAAIEKTVFCDHSLTLSELVRALKADFDGYENVQKLLLAAPKYGNGDDFADKYAVWYTRFVSEELHRRRTPDGGPVYSGMASNISNIHAGFEIGATPDGRRAGMPLSDAASPTYGCDTRGVTATLLSLSKPDYTLVGTGSVVNQKFLPTVFREENIPKLRAMIRVYFARGGQEIQINATEPEILRDAMEHPEKYRNLVVRVSGFSAYYTTLIREVQEDILRRTEQTI